MTVVVFGSINMDIVTRCRHHPHIGETIHGDSVTFYPGGKGANQAIASAKAGAETHLLGVVGKDAFGTQLLDYLRNNGVLVDNILQIELPTGIAAINVADDASNTIVVVAGANGETKASPSIIQALEHPVGLAQLETPIKEVAHFFSLIKGANGVTILNPSPYQPIEKSLLQVTDILILNEVEFSKFAGLSGNIDATNAAHILGNMECDISCLIVTLGRDGCVVKTNNSVEYIKGVPCKAIDTTGAGDCFAGVFAASLNDGRTYCSAAERANRAASISVTRAGAGPSMPEQAEIDI
ncbi:MAG: ribokinase [Alphaproteobacteria bacterium]|nr:ribokinase [Alphaproteobacteria bacterium]MBV8549516.1 ribokinase [Alphaproteobacteria bacterium]